MLRVLLNRSLTGIGTPNIDGRCDECDELVFEDDCDATFCYTCGEATHYQCAVPACPACFGRRWTCWEMRDRERSSAKCIEADELQLCRLCADTLKEKNGNAHAAEDAAFQEEFDAEREALGEGIHLLPHWQRPPS